MILLHYYPCSHIKNGIQYTITTLRILFQISHIFQLSYRLTKWLECSPMVQKTWVQSQVASYQKLWKWYLIHLCLTLSNIKYVSRVKWSNPGEGVVPSPTPRCCSYWKGNLLVTLDYDRQLYLLTDSLHYFLSVNSSNTFKMSKDYSKKSLNQNWNPFLGFIRSFTQKVESDWENTLMVE